MRSKAVLYLFIKFSFCELTLFRFSRARSKIWKISIKFQFQCFVDTYPFPLHKEFTTPEGLCSKFNTTQKKCSQAKSFSNYWGRSRLLEAFIPEGERKWRFAVTVHDRSLSCLHSKRIVSSKNTEINQSSTNQVAFLWNRFYRNVRNSHDVSFFSDDD